MQNRYLVMIILSVACLPKAGFGAATDSRSTSLAAESAKPLSSSAGTLAGHDPALIARLLKTDLATVQAAYSLNLTERLTWVLLRLSRDCACAPSQLMLERKTRSWGEVARLHGHGWAELMDELDGLIEGAGWSWTLPSSAQLLRSSANDPDSLKRENKR